MSKVDVRFCTLCLIMEHCIIFLLLHVCTEIFGTSNSGSKRTSIYHINEFKDVAIKFYKLHIYFIFNI